MLRALIATFAAVVSTTAALGHEFWIDPHDFEVAPGETVVADLRVGQGYEGSVSSYLPVNFRRFDLVTEGGTVPVEGRMGDRPALNQAVDDPGLLIVVHVTKDSVLTYTEWEKFVAFVEHKAAEWTLEAHRARGLPETRFKEGYSRYAKSLIAVGEGQGADREIGMETEIIAGANPYTDDLSAGMPVTVFYKGAARNGAQVEIFDKSPDGAVTVSTVTTDAEGRATVPVQPGHRYMLDSVVLREPEGALADREGVVWESLWANLTFAVPGG